MAKLKNIIKQLSDDDFRAVYENLVDSNAEKSAYLLRSMRERHLSDARIMEELEVNNNAYYTLRSRLNQKIEEYLLQQMESPRTDLLKKVANINEVMFTKKRAIAVATLQKLEKELLDYDLSHELTIVYKNLKKLHINSPDYFTYSQLYNRHVAYTLAVDKAEDMLAEYFKKYGQFSLSGEDTEKLGLNLLYREMNNVCSLYTSHRLYIYQCCMNIFHRLFVEEEGQEIEEEEPIEDMLDKAEEVFDTYPLDSIYYHLRLVFEYLRHEYYNHFKVYRKAEKYYEDVNEEASALLSNYSLYTFPSQFLLTKTERCLRLHCEDKMYEENPELFLSHETDEEDIPKYVTYIMYRALSCFYAKEYAQSAKWINNLLNNLSLKKYPYALIEIKTLLALQYCFMKDYDLFNQLVNSVQRQVRILGKNNCEQTINFIKIMKIGVSDAKRDKEIKIRSLISRNEAIPLRVFSCTKHVRLDDDFIRELCS